MIHHIYQTPYLDRQLDKLRKSDKKGKRVARQIDTIIDILSSCSDPCQELKHKQTRYGELRLSNCRKYDLGSGYRLITVWDEGCVIFAFAGSHDECHLWLEKQKDTVSNALSLKASCTLITARCCRPRHDEHSPQADTVFETDLYEEDLLQRLDDKTMRYISRGLCRST